MKKNLLSIAAVIAIATGISLIFHYTSEGKTSAEANIDFVSFVLGGFAFSFLGLSVLYTQIVRKRNKAIA